MLCRRLHFLCESANCERSSRRVNFLAIFSTVDGLNVEELVAWTLQPVTSARTKPLLSAAGWWRGAVSLIGLERRVDAGWTLNRDVSLMMMIRREMPPSRGIWGAHR